MPVEELSQRLQRYAQKVVRDRAYVAPEVEDAWLESKIVVQERQRPGNLGARL